MNNDVLLKEIELLKWQVDLLRKNINFNSAFDRLVFDLGLSKDEQKQIIALFHRYSENLNNESHRYPFEEEMKNINPLFGTNTQEVEGLLKYFAEEVDEEKFKILFIKLYGEMDKFEGVFPEIE